jgi:hypothetical protein
MGYIGRSVDKISNIETLDNITFDGSSSYSLTKNSVGFSPSASQNILISIDGVVQSGNFTVSGSTIDFGVAISSSSVCNFIIHLGVGLVTSPSDGSVGTSQLSSGAVTNDKISATAGISTTKLGTGAVLQVVSTTKSDTFTSSVNSTWTDITGLSLSITPSSTSNKILVFMSVQGTLFRPGLNAVHFRLNRSGTAIGIGDASGSQVRTTLSDTVDGTDNITSASTQFLDSPSSTSALTYKLQFWQDTPANPFYINRTVNDSATAHARCISSITAMEIAG